MFVAALRCDGITAPCVLNGPINGRSFLCYVEQFLVPTLQPKDVLVMHNLGSRKGRAVRCAHPRRWRQIDLSAPPTALI
jgi:transposase